MNYQPDLRLPATTQFFNLLFSRAPAGSMVELRLIPEGGGRPEQRWYRLGGALSIPNIAEGALAANGRQHVYYGTYPRFPIDGRRGGKAENIRQVSHLYADIDFKAFDPDDSAGQGREMAMAALETFTGRYQLPPSVVVETGGGFHVYWLLEEALLLETDEARLNVTRAIWSLTHACGVPTEHAGEAADLPRVLRVPGTANIKARYAPDFPTCRIAEMHPDHQYPWEAFSPVIEAGREAYLAHKGSLAKRSGGRRPLAEAGTPIRGMEGFRKASIQDLKASVTPWEAIDLLGLALPYEGQGRYAYARCLWHSDDGRSNLTLYPNGYYCFRCEAHGSVLDLIRRLMQIEENLDHIEDVPMPKAVEALKRAVWRKLRMREHQGA